MPPCFLYYLSDVLVTTFSHFGAPLAYQAAARGRPASGRLAFQVPRMAHAFSVPSAPRRNLREVADVHRLRRLRRDSSCPRCRAVRAMGGGGQVIDSRLVKAEAYGLGFDLAGVASLGPAESAEKFEDWLARGYAGEMEYLGRGAGKRADSRLPFPGARSAVVVGLNYGGTSPPGPVARYARGDDYHDVMWRRLDKLHEWIDRQAGRPIAGKSYVDTGPILERDLARRAGLGWFGKNTNLVNPRLGSFFFIGALVVDVELVPDKPFEADRCGTCTRCLEACPTNAFVAPRVLDATRCISYLTIEAKGDIPEDLRPAVGELLYGCDICQI